jgi:hypothetical protein
MGRHASQAPRKVGSGPCLVRVASCPPGCSPAWAGSQVAFSPLKDGDGERAVQRCPWRTSIAGGSSPHRFRPRGTSHGSVDRPGGVVNTGSHTSYMEVSS